MATLEWPGALPQDFDLRNYSEQTPDLLIRDQFDTGPAGVRPRSTADVFPISGHMLMTTAQWELLKVFCTDTTVQRSQAFGFPEQGASSPGEWLVRFTAPPVRIPAGGDLWDVALAFEVLPS